MNCQKCYNRIDVIIGEDGQVVTKANPGSITMCEHCGQVYRTTAHGNFEPLTEKELEIISDNFPTVAKGIRASTDVIAERIKLN